MAAATDPAQREMFPTLDDAQIERLRAAGHERAIHAGEILFEQGEVSSKFFVVLEGSIDVVHPYAGGEHPITVHEPGSFTEWSAGSKSIVACCASLVMSISTGPGRPERAMWKAWRSVGAMSCARVTR